ncbi:MAG: polysaccharide biosynthesis/export family protein [Oceanicaulis sp.]
MRIIAVTAVRLTAFAALCLIALVACSATASTGGAAAGAAEAPAGAAALEAVEYQLGAGDQVRIIVFDEEELSGEFVVDGDGMVSLPLIGEVRAENRTVRGFQAAVADALRGGYLNDPRVNVEVLNYRPYYILGEVETSGEYPYTDGLTVMNAVATAGGFTYRANTRRVFIRRAGASEEVEVPLNADLRVRPGDTIRIAERFF